MSLLALVRGVGRPGGALGGLGARHVVTAARQPPAWHAGGRAPFALRWKSTTAGQAPPSTSTAELAAKSSCRQTSRRARATGLFALGGARVARLARVKRTKGSGWWSVARAEMVWGS